jgi:hypothetical protein
VLGQRFDVSELARMSGQAEADVLDGLAESLAAGLLRSADRRAASGAEEPAGEPALR